MSERVREPFDTNYAPWSRKSEHHLSNLHMSFLSAVKSQLKTEQSAIDEALCRMSADGDKAIERTLALIEQGADPNGWRDEHYDYSALVACCWAADGDRVKTVQALLRAGADANAARKDGRTALFFAASGGHLELVKLLVEGGADIDHRDEANQTAHVFAARNPTNGEHTAGEKACVDWLAHHAKIGDKLDSATLREALIDERR